MSDAWHRNGMENCGPSTAFVNMNSEIDLALTIILWRRSFDDDEACKRWLLKQNEALGGRAPIDLLAAGQAGEFAEFLLDTLTGQPTRQAVKRAVERGFEQAARGEVHDLGDFSRFARGLPVIVERMSANLRLRRISAAKARSAVLNLARRSMQSCIQCLVELGHPPHGAVEIVWELACAEINARRGHKWRRERRAIAEKFGADWDKPGYTYTAAFRNRSNARPRRA